jgi:hypothetical protein
MAQSSNLVPNIDHVALDFCFKPHSLNLDISLYLLISYGVWTWNMYFQFFIIRNLDLVTLTCYLITNDYVFFYNFDYD